MDIIFTTRAAPPPSSPLPAGINSSRNGVRSAGGGGGILPPPTFQFAQPPLSPLKPPPMAVLVEEEREEDEEEDENEQDDDDTAEEEDEDTMEEDCDEEEDDEDDYDGGYDDDEGKRKEEDEMLEENGKKEEEKTKNKEDKEKEEKKKNEEHAIKEDGRIDVHHDEEGNERRAGEEEKKEEEEKEEKISRKMPKFNAADEVTNGNSAQKSNECRREAESSSVFLDANEITTAPTAEEEQRQKLALVEEKALRLFKLCDQDSKGFILRSELDELQQRVSAEQFVQLERAFVLADYRRVNLVYRRDFLGVLKPFLLGEEDTRTFPSTKNNKLKLTRLKMAATSNGISSSTATDFQAISLDHDGARKSSSDDWSPTQKLTIAIDEQHGGGGGLATFNHLNSNELLSIDGYLGHNHHAGGLSPATSSAGGLWTGSHSPSSHSGISLHDELMLKKIETAVTCTPSERSNGLCAQVVLREVQSPGSTCSEPLPMKENGDPFFSRRPTCGNPPHLNRHYSMDQDSHCPDRIFKVVFVGDSAVGKTCFLHRYCHNRFKPLFSATIGVDFTVKTLSVRNRFVALQLWDTAGQERFRSITKQYFRKADGVVLMYDVTSETSFINVRNWVESVRVGVDDGCVLCLVGNKVDLYPNEHCRTITYQHGKELAEEFDMLFFETSAFTGQGIDECMQALASRLQQREDEHMDELIKLEAQMAGGGSNRSWCCI